MTSRQQAYYEPIRDMFHVDDSLSQEGAKIEGILEALVDRFTLPVILSALADMCAGKAAHIRDNWQDDSTAKVWARSALECNRIALKL